MDSAETQKNNYSHIVRTRALRTCRKHSTNIIRSVEQFSKYRLRCGTCTIVYNFFIVRAYWICFQEGEIYRIGFQVEEKKINKNYEMLLA